YCGANCSGLKLLDLLDTYISKQYPEILTPLDLVSKAVALHQAGDHFNGSKIGFTLDPFVSISPHPDYAMEFLPMGTPGHFLVLTLPENVVHQPCPNGFPSPGELVLST